MNTRSTLGYIDDTLRLRERQALEYPVAYLFSEAVRAASVMALIVAIMDVLSPGAFEMAAGERLQFVVLFGVVISLFNFIRFRARGRSRAA